MFWRNEKYKFITLSEIINNISYDKLLSIIPLSIIKKFITDNDKPKSEEYINSVLKDGFGTYVEVDKDDIDISEYDDYEIINEYNDRKLYKKNNIDSNCTIKSFLEKNYGIFINAYSDYEILSFIKEQLDKEKY